MSALWGKGGRGFIGAFVLALAVALVGASTAWTAPGPGKGDAFVTPGLLERAEANPDATFAVIVQGEGGKKSDAVADEIRAARAQDPGKGQGLKRKFVSIAGVSAELTGKQLAKLAAKQGIFAITEDASTKLAAGGTKTYESEWPTAAGVPTVSTWAKPTIAIVDSGVDASHPAFGGRVLKQVTITGLTPNSPGDGRGHGTLVAGIAVGAGRSYPGVAPDTKIVSLDVMDDNGMGLTSDVIAACDWILQNKDAYGIRVANFSLHTAVPTSFMYDPLNKAVEKLWFSGVVVVAAAGNYAIDGQPSGVPYAPANDPFVITVGADDIGGSRPRSDDKNSPWSAYGYTYDGFYKPEVVAPGRYMVAAVPPSSTMALARPDRVVAPGYMWMSGTSLAAPVVAGGAAQVLSRHPDWTPDQVKGAFMLTTQPVYDATPDSVGVGQIHITMAWSDTLDPPNPNLALNQFVVPDPAGGYAFDAASWASAAQADASWNSASWNSASWNSASWNSASWNSASWNSASWNSASWNSASWNSAAALTWVE